jgi:hydrogenase expression/formation protein HypD
MKYVEEYRDPHLARHLIHKIAAIGTTPIRIMEVCGTHTVSIFRSGIRSLLPATLSLISGPGCPVCVTDQREIDAAIALAGLENVILTTFGDLMRVPGSISSLQKKQAAGSDIRIVYSTSDALDLARRHPDRQVVFLGVGFETTIPTVAAAVLAAAEAGISNFFVYCAHKCMPPALDVLMADPETGIDGFLLPGHVSAIIGTESYLPFFEKYRIPCVVAGFEPVDILQAVLRLSEMIQADAPGLENAYPRAVRPEGNPAALKIIREVFEPCDAIWRGIGRIPESGFRFREKYRRYDAESHFQINVPAAVMPKGCACGDILTGKKMPPDCPLYKTRCTPVNPVGPCMVSSEGTCAAYFKYSG